VHSTEDIRTRIISPAPDRTVFSHHFIGSGPEEWKSRKSVTGLEPSTGGVVSNGSASGGPLFNGRGDFVYRDRSKLEAKMTSEPQVGLGGASQGSQNCPLGRGDALQVRTAIQGLIAISVSLNKFHSNALCGLWLDEIRSQSQVLKGLRVLRHSTATNLGSCCMCVAACG
jgi:hypothetical protein